MKLPSLGLNYKKKRSGTSINRNQNFGTFAPVRGFAQTTNSARKEKFKFVNRKGI